MFGTKTHKWLFSFTLLVSLISFSGFANEPINHNTAQVELVETKNISNSLYCANFYGQYLLPELDDYFSFYFKVFLQTENGLILTKESIQEQVGLSQKNSFNMFYTRLILKPQIDDYHTTLIV